MLQMRNEKEEASDEVRYPGLSRGLVKASEGHPESDQPGFLKRATTPANA
jgi:hypothetical protein